MPYAVSQGGWMSLGCLAALLPLFGLTGQVGVRAVGWVDEALRCVAPPCSPCFRHSSIRRNLLDLLPLQLICRAFDLMPPTAAKTYPSLGRAAGGTAGFAAVLFFSILELFGGTLVLLMVCWQMMELLLPTEGASNFVPECRLSAQSHSVPASLPSHPILSHPFHSIPLPITLQASARCARCRWPPRCPAPACCRCCSQTCAA